MTKEKTMSAYYIRTQRLNDTVGDTDGPTLFATRKEARACADKLQERTPSKYGKLIVSEWKPTYKSRSAQDAQRMNYGGERYWNYLEETAKRYAAAGIEDAMTRTLSECLQGNDGD